MAFILLVVFVLLGVAIHGSENIKETLGYSGDVLLEEVKIDDGGDLLLLNYMKVKTSDGRVMKDVILAAENDDETFEYLIEETENIVAVFNRVRFFDIRIFYPESERRIKEGEPELKYEIKFPNENGDIITVRAGFTFVWEAI